MTEAERQAIALDQYEGTEIYGLQWGDPNVVEDFIVIRDEWIKPNVRGNTVIEIGPGGGRWTQFMGEAKWLILIDGTDMFVEKMENSGVIEKLPFLRTCAQCNDGNFCKDCPVFCKSADYVFSFDTFVHFHDELFDEYIDSIAMSLRIGGKLHIHYGKDTGEIKHEGDRWFYQDDKVIDEKFKKVGLVPSGRPDMNFHRGFGSVLREFVAE